MTTDTLASILRSAHVLLEELAEEGVDRILPLPAETVESPEPIPGQAPPHDLARTAVDPPGEAVTDRSPASLDEVRAQLGECTRCKLHERRTKIVFGEGDPNAEIMFVGEGPGEQEDLRGIPFCGRAGELLTSMIEKGMGLPRSSVYICNVVKCRPPNNRTPEPDEVSCCRPFLEAQIAVIRPKVIIALGKPAASLLIGRNVAITRERGQWRSYGDTPVMPTFHPAYLLRQYTPENRRLVWEDLTAALAKARES